MPPPLAACFEIENGSSKYRRCQLGCKTCAVVPTSCISIAQEMQQKFREFSEESFTSLQLLARKEFSRFRSRDSKSSGPMLSIGPAPLSLGQQQDLRSDSQLHIQLDIANSLRAIAVMMARSEEPHLAEALGTRNNASLPKGTFLVSVETELNVRRSGSPVSKSPRTSDVTPPSTELTIPNTRTRQLYSSATLNTCAVWSDGGYVHWRFHVSVNH
ncbi:hypothetical protein HDV62DRAFT_260440 [Trichoderma sp. SZMC 28011]